MYRDDHAAAEERISALQSLADERAAEIDRLQASLDEREDAIVAAVAKTRGRSLAEWQLVAALAVVVTAITAGATLVPAARAAHSASTPRGAAGEPSFADPLDEPVAGSGDAQLAVWLRQQLRERHDQEVLVMERRAALQARFDEGDATTEELKLLRLICIYDRDLWCEERTTRVLDERSVSGAPSADEGGAE